MGNKCCKEPAVASTKGIGEIEGKKLDAPKRKKNKYVAPPSLDDIESVTGSYHCVPRNVRATRKYTPSKGEETVLAVKKGQEMLVFGEPVDDWCRVKLEHSGATGFVPLFVVDGSWRKTKEKQHYDSSEPDTAQDIYENPDHLVTTNEADDDDYANAQVINELAKAKAATIDTNPEQEDYVDPHAVLDGRNDEDEDDDEEDYVLPSESVTGAHTNDAFVDDESSCFVRAKRDHESVGDTILSFKEGDVMKIVTKTTEEWWWVELVTGEPRTGYVSPGHVESCDKPSQQQKPTEDPHVEKQAPQSVERTITRPTHHTKPASTKSEVPNGTDIVAKDHSVYGNALPAAITSFPKGKSSELSPNSCPTIVKQAQQAKTSNNSQPKPGNSLRDSPKKPPTTDESTTDVTPEPKVQRPKLAVPDIPCPMVPVSPPTSSDPVSKDSSDQKLSEQAETLEKRVKAIGDYLSDTPGDLKIKQGDILIILDDSTKWWTAQNEKTGETGLIPPTYVELLENNSVKLSVKPTVPSQESPKAVEQVQSVITNKITKAAKIPETPQKPVGVSKPKPRVPNIPEKPAMVKDESKSTSTKPAPVEEKSSALRLARANSCCKSPVDDFLSVSKGDIIEILNDEGIKYLAKCQKTGKQGLISKAVVDLIEKPTESGSLESYLWFQGKIPREEALAKLKQSANGIGSFMVRESQHNPGSYTLSFVGIENAKGEKVKNFVIQHPSPTEFIILKNTFSSLPELVEACKASSNICGLQLTKACV